MLVDKLTVNVGESVTMYIEMYDSNNTPESILKYGDIKWDDNGKLVVWYGSDKSSDMSGWVNPPWGANDYSSGIVQMAANSKSNPKDVIYRIMNNDIDFNEEAYTAKVVESDNE